MADGLLRYLNYDRCNCPSRSINSYQRPQSNTVRRADSKGVRIESPDWDGYLKQPGGPVKRKAISQDRKMRWELVRLSCRLSWDGPYSVPLRIERGSSSGATLVALPSRVEPAGFDEHSAPCKHSSLRPKQSASGSFAKSGAMPIHTNPPFVSCYVPSSLESFRHVHCPRPGRSSRQRLLFGFRIPIVLSHQRPEASIPWQIASPGPDWSVFVNTRVY
jgi:hypothetical protein